MRILSEEEGRNLHPLGKGRHTHLHAMISMMKTGQRIHIEKKDWVTKHPPHKVVRTAAKKFNYQLDCGRHPGGNGWLVERLG